MRRISWEEPDFFDVVANVDFMLRYMFQLELALSTALGELIAICESSVAVRRLSRFGIQEYIVARQISICYLMDILSASYCWEAGDIGPAYLLLKEIYWSRYAADRELAVLLDLLDIDVNLFEQDQIGARITLNALRCMFPNTYDQMPANYKDQAKKTVCEMQRL